MLITIGHKTKNLLRKHPKYPIIIVQTKICHSRESGNPVFLRKSILSSERKNTFFKKTVVRNKC